MFDTVVDLCHLSRIRRLRETIIQLVSIRSHFGSPASLKASMLKGAVEHVTKKGQSKA